MTNDRLPALYDLDDCEANSAWYNDRSLTIMSPEDIAKGKRRKLWTKLEINGLVRNLSPTLWEMSHLTVLYLNDNNLQRLPPDIGKLTNLRCLDLSNNKLRILPTEIGDLILLKELLLNDNYLRTLPFELGKLFKLQKLSLKGNSLGNDMLQLYNEQKGTQKLLSYLLDILTIQNPAPRPSPRPWIVTHQPADRTKPSCMFTVMCYNVLCDKYVSRHLYGYCPNWALKWEYRRQAILDELKSNSADVIALEEIESEQFHDHLLVDLRAEGYEGVFSPKSRFKTMSLEEKKHVDGCAIFYKTSKFILISEHLIEFNQLAMANAQGSDVMLNRVMTKDNIALAALLHIKEDAFESINANDGSDGNNQQQQQPSMTTINMSKFNSNGGNSTTTTTSSTTTTTTSTTTSTNLSTNTKLIPIHQQRILVCAAHIHWDPQYCDVKIIQTIMLTHELQTIVSQAAKQLIEANGETISSVMRTYNIQVPANQPKRYSANNILDAHDSNSSSSSSASGDEQLLELVGPQLIPVILCGDFNSLPDSGVYEFLTKGSISVDHKDFKKLAYKDCLRRICSSKSSAMANTQQQSQLNHSHQYSTQLPRHNTTLDNTESIIDDQLEFDETVNNENGLQRRVNNGQSLLNDSNEHNTYTHPFNLASAYTDKKTMAYTNYAFHFKGIIDYIFYSSNFMSVLGVSGFDKTWLEENKIAGLPHPYFPSDHLPLYVELEILPTPRNLQNKFNLDQPHQQQSLIQTQQHNKKNDFFQNSMRKPFFGT